MMPLPSIISALRFASLKLPGQHTLTQITRTDAQIRDFVLARMGALRAEALADGGLTARDEQALAADQQIVDALQAGGE